MTDESWSVVDSAGGEFVVADEQTLSQTSRYVTTHYRAHRVISKPHNYSSRSCDICDEAFGNSGPRPFCVGCSVYEPSGTMLELGRKLAKYEHDLTRVRRGEKLPADSEVLKDILIYHRYDGYREALISKILGIKSKDVLRVLADNNIEPKRRKRGEMQRIRKIYNERSPLIKLAKLSSVGKITHDGIYVHRSALRELNEVLRSRVVKAQGLLPRGVIWSVVKVNLVKPLVTFSDYESFKDVEHPALRRCQVINLDTSDVKARDYSQSDNPPILHRKELLVSKGYPGRARFARLTHSELHYGLLGNGQIGFKQQWEELLAARGLEIHDHKVVEKVAS